MTVSQDVAPFASGDDAPAAGGHGSTAALARFLLLSWILVLLDTLRLVLDAGWQGVLGEAFLLVAWPSFGALYLLPAALAAFSLDWIGRRPAVSRALGALRLPAAAPACAAAVVLVTATQLLLHADVVVHRLYGFHLNGFVWNIVLTPGGLESLGADPAAQWTVAALAGCVLGVEAVLLVLAFRLPALRDLGGRVAARLRPRTGIVLLAAALLACEAAQAASDLFDVRTVLAASDAIPLFVTIRLPGLARRLGTRHAGRDLPGWSVDAKHLGYPIRSPEAGPAPRDLNIVFLVAESLRADMLDPEVMPETSAFAPKCVDFRDHYSSGNGTEMAIFGMFYALPGPYWSPLLQARRGPVFVDYLLGRGYDVEAYTSASFTYPEFDRTVWSRIPPERLHAAEPGLLGWQNDRKNVGALLESIDGRDKSRPFFRFLFFESPHARYYFPPECAIRKPFLETLNYANMDLQRDMPLIWNRYVNSCRHLDTQFGRMIRGLEERGLLDSTVLIMTGDHGEEFLERGRWGHHSGFNRFQTRVPLLLHAPGVAPAVVTRLTSHLDLTPTVLALMGVKTPPEDYGSGFDLLGPAVRTDTIVSAYDDLALRGKDATVVLPSGGASVTRVTVLDRDDRPLPPGDSEAALRAAAPRLRELFRELGRFRK